ncbi:MAG: hypothetical protein NTZ84_02910, partial [Candidatus Nealsonbacteria bacterium]|nr:hypothetical protein [Candidatus Nealsonbacteria bacterium]
MGNSFCENFDFSKLEFISKDNFIIKKENWESYNYSGEIGEASLKLAKIHDEAFGKFIFVSDKDEICSIKSRKDPENNVVLFNDQYKVLKELL